VLHNVAHVSLQLFTYTSTVHVSTPWDGNVQFTALASLISEKWLLRLSPERRSPYLVMLRLGLFGPPFIFLKRSFIIIIIIFIVFIIFIPESFHFSGLSQCMFRFLCYVASVVSVAQMLGISLPQSIEIYRNKSRRLATRLRYLLTRIASSLFTCFKDLYESWNNWS
jgi:hypothetical protein